MSCWQELDGWLFSSRMFKWKFTIKAAVFEKTDLGIVVWSYLEFSSTGYDSLLPPRPLKDSLRYCLFSCVAVCSAWERRERKQSCCIWLGEVDLRWNACCHYVCWQFISPAKLIFAPRHAGTGWVFPSSMLCLKLLAAAVTLNCRIKRESLFKYVCLEFFKQVVIFVFYSSCEFLSLKVKRKSKLTMFAFSLHAFQWCMLFKRTIFVRV